MASDFLKKKAAEQRAKNGGSSSASASVSNTSTNTTAPKASGFLQKKAAERAAVMDEKYGQDSYGGSAWREQKIATADTRYRNNRYKNKYLGMTESQMQRAIWNLEDGEEKNWLLDNRQSLLNESYRRENENKFFQLGNDARAADSYHAGKQAQSDAERLRNAFAETILPVGGYENPVISKYLKTSENENLDYLEEKYGTRNYLQLKRLIDAEIDTYSSELEDAGFNFDRMADYEQRQQDEHDRAAEKAENRKFADEHGILSSLATIGAAPAQGIDYLAMVGQQVQNRFRGEDDWRPINTDNMDVTNFVTDIRGRVGENIEGGTDWEIGGQNVARFLYDTAMSMGDSAATIMLAGPAATYLLGGAAASQTAKQVLENGGSASQATMSGFAAGAAEAVFEKYSIEGLLKQRDVTSVKRLLTETLKQSGVEASEEMATEVANILSNAVIMGRDSDFNRTVEFYMSESGGSMSEDAAKKQAFYDCIEQVAWAGAGGALSGGIMGGGVNAANLYGNVQQMQRQYGDDPKAIIDEALQVNPNNTEALALRKTLEEGGTVTPYQLTKMRGVTAETVDDRLEAVKKADEKLGRKQWMTDAKRTEREQAVFEASEQYGAQAETMRNVYKLGENQDASEFEKAYKIAFDLGKGHGENNFELAMTSPATAYLTEKQKMLAFEAGREAYNKSNEGKAVSIDTNEALEIESIESVENGVITFRLANGETVQSDNVAHASRSDTQLYDTLSRMSMDSASANAIVGAFRARSGVTAGGFVQNVERAYRYGKRGMTMEELQKHVLGKEMSQEALEAAYYAGKKQAKTETNAAQAALDRSRQGKKADKVGRVLWMGQQATKNTAEDGGVKLQARVADGKQVVWINDNILKNNPGLPEHQYVANYIANHIGEVYTIIESGQKVYIGADLPNEYTQSQYTQNILKNRRGLADAKNRAASNIGEMIEIATNRRWEQTKHGHNKDAKYGVYRYDTRFAFPVKNAKGDVIGANAYKAQLVIRNASDGKKYLYDIVSIKKDTTTSTWLTNHVTRAAANATAGKGNAYTNSVRNIQGNVNKKNSSRTKGKQEIQSFREHLQQNGTQLSEVQEASIFGMERLTALMGVDMYVFESYLNDDGERVYLDEHGREVPAPNGYYENGNVYIDLNAGQRGEGTMLFTVAHELTHFIQEWSPAKYDVLCEVIMDGYARAGISVDQQVREQIIKAAENGRTLSYEEAFDEVIADSMESMLADGRVIEMMAQLKQRDKSLWEKICDFFTELLEDLKAMVNAYKHHKPNSKEGRMVADMQEVIDQIQPIFAEALLDAGETRQTATKNTAEDGGVRYSIRDTNIKRNMIEYGDYASENRKVKNTAEGIIANNKTVVIEAERISEHDSSVDWDNKKEVRNYLKSILKQFAGDSVYFTHNGQAIEAYLTKDGINHSVTGNVTAETAAVFERICDLIVNAEYSYSSQNDEHSNINKKIGGNIDWDCFVAVATVGVIDYPVVFKLRTLDVDLRSQIYSAAEKREIGVSHDGGQQENLMDAQSNYGASPIYDDTVSQTENSVKKFSDRSRKTAATLERDGAVFADNKNGRKYSERNKKRITASMTDTERTEILRDKVIEAAVYEGQADESILREQADLESGKIGLVKSALVRIGEEFDVFTDYEVSDVEVKFQLSRGNLKESVSKDVSGVQLAKLLPVLKPAVENAVGIECHENRYYYDNNTVLFENLLGGYVENDSFVPVRFGLKHSTNGKTTLYVIVDQIPIALEKIKAEVVKMAHANDMRSNISRSAYDYSVSTIVPFVNGKDLLRYLPDDMLTNSQKKVKWAAIADTIVRTNDKNDKHYIEAVRSGNVGAAKNMVMAAAKANGYTVEAWHGTPSNGFTVFDRKKIGTTTDDGLFGQGFYFTTNKLTADGYATPSGKTMDVYLKAEKPWWSVAHRNIHEVAEELGMEESALTYRRNAISKRIVSPQMSQSGQFTAHLMERGYDSVVIQHGANDYEIVVFNPEQIKSADVITYDENDKIIPISQRFNSQNPDIRFSDRSRKTAATLERQNERLKQDVSYLKQMVRLQKAIPNNTPMVLETTKRLMEKANAKGNAKEAAVHLMSFYEYIAKGRGLTAESVREAAQPMIDWLQKHERDNRQPDPRAQEILGILKKTNVRFSEAQKKEASILAGGWGMYRNGLLGSVFISDKANTTLDQLWADLSRTYPDVFDGSISDTEQVAALEQVIEELRNTYVETEQYDDALVEAELFNEMYDSYWDSDYIPAVTDQHAEEVRKLKEKHKAEMAELKSELEESKKQVQLERKELIDRIRQEEREKGWQKQKELQKKHTDSRKRATERQAKTLERQKIRRNIQSLRNLLRKTNTDQNVKDGLREFVEAALNASEVLFIEHYSNEDMLRNGIGTPLTKTEEKHVKEAQQLLEQMDAMKGPNFSQGKYWKLQDELKKHKDKLSDVFVRERTHLLSTPVADVLQKLIDVYGRLQYAEESYISAAYDERVFWELTAMREELTVAAVKDMDLQQLKELNDMYSMVLASVRNANKMFCAGKKATVQGYAESAMAELQKQERKNQIERKALGKVKKFAWDNLKPIYAFRRIGSNTMTELYENIRAGEDVWARDMVEARQVRERLEKKYGYRNWDMEEQFEFTSSTGKQFKLNLGQLMSIYAYSRRENAEEHLRYGGIVIDESTEIKVKNKLGLTETFNPAKATAYNLTDITLADMIATLNQEQKAFVEEMQKYLSDNMGAKGNEVSMQLYGIKQFGEQNYFPLKSAAQYLARARDQKDMVIKLKNSGFTKARTPSAKNPIVLTGFMETWADHVNQMSMYHGFALPLEDFYKVYNYSLTNLDDTDSVSVNALIQNAHGAGATAYIDQLLKDVNGDVVTDNRENFGKSMVAKFKKAAVFTSLSVVVQQPSAVGRAFAMVDPRHFKKVVGIRESKKIMEEMREFAPVSIIKEMGYFDTNMGMSARDYLLAQEYDGWKDKAAAMLHDPQYRDEALGRLPALADELTWCTIWEAVKRECIAADAKLVAGSEEHLMRTGKRFTEVITRTQVYDSVLSRSANMRSKSTFMGMLTSFMAEPTTSINMLEDAVRVGLSGDKKAAARTVGAVFTSVLINSLLSSLVCAMRDDDKDETFWEKYASSFATEMLDGINPMTYVPILRDIWSVALGYDVERADMSLITEFSDTLTNIKNVLNRDTRDMTEEELEQYDRERTEALWQLTDVMASLLGISWKNVRRDMKAVVNFVETVSADNKNTVGTITDKLVEGFWEAVPELLRPESKTKKEILLEAYLENNSEMKRRLLNSYEDEEAMLRSLKGAAKDAYQSGEMSKQDTMTLLKKHVGLSDKELEKTINQWSCIVVTGIDYEDIKDEFIEGNITEQRAKEMRVRYGGDTSEEAAETVKSWKFEKQWGFTYSDRKDAYVNGEVTESEMRKILIEHGGMSEKEAESYMKAYNWMKKHPDYDLNVNEALAYTRTVDTLGVSAEDVGISPNVFVEYKELSAACKGVDGDGDGQADRNTKKNQILAVIDDLPISDYQKDVLYYMNGWAKSTLRKAPWH